MVDTLQGACYSQGWKNLGSRFLSLTNFQMIRKSTIIKDNRGKITPYETESSSSTQVPDCVIAMSIANGPNPYRATSPGPY